MKVTFATICLNEAEYIGRNIAQHVDLCDEWIFVEGADRRYPPRHVTADGLSKDGTATAICREASALHAMGHDKITLIKHGWAADKSELRNRYAELCDDGVVIVFDADEFLTRADLEWLIARCKSMPTPGSVRIPHIHFWKHRRQIITGGYYDVPHDRAYRWQRGCRYFENHNNPCLPDGTALQSLSYERHERELMLEPETGGFAHPKPCWLHMGFAKSDANVADKNAYYLNRGEAYSRPETTESRAAFFADTLPAGHRTYPWCGKLPEVLEQERAAA